MQPPLPPWSFGPTGDSSYDDVVTIICNILDELHPRQDGQSYKEQISYVTDRLGHDFRYAIDSARTEKALNFKCEKSFEESLADTVRWYLDNQKWCETVLEKKWRVLF